MSWRSSCSAPRGAPAGQVALVVPALVVADEAGRPGGSTSALRAAAVRPGPRGSARASSGAHLSAGTGAGSPGRAPGRRPDRTRRGRRGGQGQQGQGGGEECAHDGEAAAERSVSAQPTTPAKGIRRTGPAATVRAPPMGFPRPVAAAQVPSPSEQFPGAEAAFMNRRFALIQAMFSLVALAAVIWWASKQEAPTFPNEACSYRGSRGAAALRAGHPAARRALAPDPPAHRCAGLAHRLYALTIVGYMGNNVLPARAGEVLKRGAALRARCDAGKRELLGTVVAERILDALALAVIFVVVVYGALSSSVLPSDRPLSWSEAGCCCWWPRGSRCGSCAAAMLRSRARLAAAARRRAACAARTRRGGAARRARS